MEKLDLNEILIKDSEYYNPSASYTWLLKKKKINTVGQLLDGRVDINFLKYYSYNTRSQLVGFISVLRYKYYGEPLYTDALMNEEINFEENYGNGIIFDTHNTKFESVSFAKLFGCPGVKIAPIFKEFKNASFPQEIKLIDFLKWILKEDRNDFKPLCPYANAFIESYENSKRNKVVLADDSEVQINVLIKQAKKYLDLLDKNKMYNNVKEQLTILMNCRNIIESVIVRDEKLIDSKKNKR